MLSTLVLVPTEYELECLTPLFQHRLQSHNSAAHVCGFGPVLSGILAARLIAQWSPVRVFLLGIAGTYDAAISLASFIEFDEVACYGIGVGSGKDFVPASEMGWNQWSGTSSIISDSITLRDQSGRNPSMQLLTCCSASANQEQVSDRLLRFPNAKAEDMEGFSVAAACKLAGIPLRIFRGISNQAGDRNKNNWRIREAMASVESAVSIIIR